LASFFVNVTSKVYVGSFKHTTSHRICIAAQYQIPDIFPFSRKITLTVQLISQKPVIIYKLQDSKLSGTNTALISTF